jgi:thiamine biosynthesis lipoprotein
MLLVDGPADLAAVRARVDAEIGAIDDTCSRFRADSELSQLNANPGRPLAVSPTLAEALAVALRAAELTDGRVDPTLGGELRHLGYDRDFASVPPDGSAVALRVSLPARWNAIAFDREHDIVCLPPGVELDFGATAKALAADRAAQAATDACGLGVLVSLGGDIAVAGPAPQEGWSIRVTDDHAAGLDAPGVDIAIFSGGLATSSTTVRRWRRGEEVHHHVLDPATGRPATGPWRTVSVAAGSCVDANLASTAAIVMGAEAPAWLSERGLPARLVAEDDSVVVVAGWPADPRDGGLA